jgi:hypothetical protein
VNLQRVSSRLLKLARDNSLWRSKCFDQSPCAATSANTRLSGSALNGVLRPTGSEEAEESAVNGHSAEWSEIDSRHQKNPSGHARAITNWDLTNELERMDWYSEYIARHSTLNATWLDERSSPPQEVRGLAISKDLTRAFGPLEDGSLCVWDVGNPNAGRLPGHNTFREISRSPVSILFEDRATVGESSTNKARLEYSGATECIAIDSDQQKAYVAVGDILNEVDLQTLQVVSQNKYAWQITALSQEDSPERSLTVGTSWSLHLHDSRMQFRERSRSPEDIFKAASAFPEDSIAFLPNYTKGIPKRYESNDAQAPPAGQFAPPLPSQAAIPTNPMSSWHSPFSSNFGQNFGGNNTVSNWQSPFGSSSGPNIDPNSVVVPRPRRSARRPTLSQYAQVEPGPLSIVHQGPDNIFIAGRFPSILSYDRRYFPNLQYVIHSGARLAGLVTLPYPPSRAASNVGVEATLVACGEYNGRGSLEIYSLPHLKQNTSQGSGSADLPEYLLEDTTDGISPEAERALSASMKLVGEAEPYNYKNRQAASPAKLLSVATQGTRIVFSDAEGGLRWVERDGYGLVRRWNVNNFEMQTSGASIQGEEVVRKIIPINPTDSDRGTRGDGDLLVWTGEKIGVITTQQSHDDVDELSKAFDDTLGNGDIDIKAEEYARVMRRALERQADERRWMSRFNMRYR